MPVNFAATALDALRTLAPPTMEALFAKGFNARPDSTYGSRTRIFGAQGRPHTTLLTALESIAVDSYERAMKSASSCVVHMGWSMCICRAKHVYATLTVDVPLFASLPFSAFGEPAASDVAQLIGGGNLVLTLHSYGAATTPTLQISYTHMSEETKRPQHTVKLQGSCELVELPCAQKMSPSTCALDYPSIPDDLLVCHATLSDTACVSGDARFTSKRSVVPDVFAGTAAVAAKTYTHWDGEFDGLLRDNLGSLLASGSQFDLSRAPYVLYGVK